MDTLTLSDITNKRFAVCHIEHNDNYRTEFYAFHIDGNEYWANAQVPTFEPNRIIVEYDQEHYEFEGIADAVYFSLGGTFVQDIVDSNNSFAMRECTKADGHSSDELTKMAFDFIDRLTKDSIITEQQAKKLKSGAEEYACVWF